MFKTVYQFIKKVSSQCTDRGAIQGSRWREYFFSGSTEKCKEITLGAIDGRTKVFFLICD